MFTRGRVLVAADPAPPSPRRVARVILYHSTSEAGKIGIEHEGFARDDRHCPKGSWFHSPKPRPDEVVATWKQDWWVMVELPDDVAALYHHRFDDGTYYDGVYCVPWDVLNQYRPFRYERWR
jgi:hypothetical protein